MSASNESSAIFLKDTEKQIKTKINKHAFSGGQETEQQQRELGGDPDVDVAYQYLTFFLEDDDLLENIRISYRKGDMLTGELKAKCAAEVYVFVKQFQERRVAVTDEIIDQFMRARQLEWRGNPNAKDPRTKPDPILTQELNEDGTPKLTKNQEKKLAKERLLAEKKAAAAAAKAAKAAEST